MKHPIFLLFQRTWHYAKGRRTVFAATIGAFFISNAINLAEPAIIGLMFNAIQQGGAPKALWGAVLKYLLLLLAIPFAFWAFHGVARVLERKTAFIIHKNYKEEFLSHAFDLPLLWHRDHHSGETINKINRASQAIFDFSGGLFEPINAVSKLIGAFIALFIILPPAGLIALITSIIATCSVLLYDRVLMRQFDDIYARENRVAAATHDYLSNIVTVVSMRLKKIGLEDVSKKIAEVFPAFKKNIVLNEVKWFSISAIIALMIFAVLGSHIYGTLKAGLPLLVGTLYSLYAYLERISGAFYDFAWQYSRMVEQASAVRSAEDISTAWKAYRAPESHTLPPAWKKIEIRHLYFTYVDEKRRQHHLEDLHLTLPRGKKIALVGSSGGGKSTLMALLRGLHQPARVELWVDGKKMEHGLQHLYDYATLLPQEPEVFADTLHYNITMGKPVAKGSLQKIIKWSRFEPVLKRLPKGLLTNIAEKGVNLSGGEKQRLALARGLLAARSRPILLMDEPTSSVDSRNELAIYEQVFAGYREKTVVASVHRLHLLGLFDHIYLISEGKIIDEGTLETLLAKNEMFRQMWNAYRKTHRNIKN